MAKPNYSFEKRQRELAKKKKKEEKARNKAAGGNNAAAQDDSQAPVEPSTADEAAGSAGVAGDATASQ